MIVFVVAHDHDHMRESITAAPEEITDAEAATAFLDTVGVRTANVGSHQDVAAEYQHINIVAVFEVEISELKVEIRSDIEFHDWVCCSNSWINACGPRPHVTRRSG